MTDDLGLLEAQQEIHELIAQQAPLEETLDAIALWIGILLPGAVVAFMRYDPARGCLSLLPSHRFSQRYLERLQNVPVGPEAASFGAAAYHRRQVFTEDIQRDPRWKAFRHEALAEGLRACWSSPVITIQGELLGTFGTYYREPSVPSASHKRQLRQAAALIALAIIRDRDSHRHRSLAERHRSLFVNHPDGVYEFDLAGRFQRGNAALEWITGYPAQCLLGHHFSEFVAPGYRELTQAAFDAAKTGESRHYETLGIHADGHSYHLAVTNFPVTIDGDIVGVYGICRDITEQRSQEARIAYQATHDLLTGLPNRSTLENRLEQDFCSSQQDQHLLALLHLDLDGFKAINQGLGYAVGNRLLVAVGERLHQLIGPGDTLARLTGDEFVFLLSSFTTREAIVAVAERILAAFESPFMIAGRTLHISASMGIACSDGPVRQAQVLLQHAERALGTAKQQGRNTWQWYHDEGRRRFNENVLLHQDLHAALREKQFELYYQPVVDAGSGEIRSVEALVRWHHPRHGLISPAIFIPIAEQTGQIIPLGRWVLRQACQSLADLHARGARMFPVAVNISSLQFRRDGFLDEVQRVLTETGLPPEFLELEMTESILLGDVEQVIEAIHVLSGMHVSIAIDDFGTGFSSLSYLRDLPIHKVKLDRAFIRNILTNHSDAAIVQGIIAMAHHLGLAVVAEGIEEREQQQDLVRRGCDLLQGYFFARPMPWEDVMALPDVLPAGAR